MGINPKNIYRQNKQIQKDQNLCEQIEKVHLIHPAYGHRRVALDLGINHKRAARIMRKFNLKPPRRKIRHYCTKSTYDHDYTNLITGITLDQVKINQVWFSDVSFIKFDNRFWYLATIEDMATRQIVAVRIGKQHNSQLILTTIKQALFSDHKPDIFHSDQGTEFMAKICTDYLKDRDIKVSVSATASPWQNSYQESFFGRFKDEFGDFNRFDTVGQLIEEIYSQIHYYNYHRIHTSLKMPPAVYATQLSDIDKCLHKRGT